MKARSLGSVCVATDDQRVADIVQGFGGRAVMTSPHFESGTDRVASIARQTRETIIVNLQGDEPLLEPAAIERLIAALSENPEAGISTLAVYRREPEALRDPNVVKTVLSSTGEALYFSRQALATDNQGGFYKHIGVYAYRREAMMRFCDLPPSRLERAERLEQLRALENGIRIQVAIVQGDTIAVDTPEDIARVEAMLDSRRDGLAYVKGEGPKDR